MKTVDFTIIGSGFGGSVSAMRLTEKGYSVVVLERGKRFRDQDFPSSNWNLPHYLWMPAIRCFGIQQMTFLKDIFILHGSGVGGGSLVYANVLMEPPDHLFDTPGWKHLIEWKNVLRPHYDTAKRMLGVNMNPCVWEADNAMKEVAAELGYADSFRHTQVAVFFGEPGKTVPDPYFNGEGPDRTGCTHCGRCMVGCQVGAKNTLVKNYLYFAEKRGAEVRPEAEVVDIRPLPEGQPDGARYEVVYERTTAWIKRPTRQTIRTRNVIVSAGVVGSLRLLFHCRDNTKSLHNISQKLGDDVRTNSEALMGITNRDGDKDMSQGIAIASVFRADESTQIEAVRYPKGSSFMRNLAAPIIGEGGTILQRIGRMIAFTLKHPMDFLRSRVLPGWAERSTILLVMQTDDHMIRMRFGRHLLTLFRRGLVSQKHDEKPLIVDMAIAHKVTKMLGKKLNAVPQGTLHETLLGVPATAHILGGCRMGNSAEDGVVDLKGEVHGYPGLYVIDGSIMPGNPGINPSLTIAALAEYAMSNIPKAERA